MDISVQNFDELTDSEYGNFLGIGKKAQKINASTSQIKAETEKLKADTIAQTKSIADTLKATEEATQAALKKAQELESMSATPSSMGGTQMADAPKSTLSKMKLPLIIGGVVLVGIVLVVALRK